MNLPIIDVENRLLRLLEQKYPDAFKKFLSTKNSNGEDTYHLFLKSFKLNLLCRETNSVNPQLKGTYVYKLHIGKRNARLLERKSSYFYYPGMKSQAAAFEKGIEKSFQVIQCLLTERTLPEQIRNR